MILYMKKQLLKDLIVKKANKFDDNVNGIPHQEIPFTVLWINRYLVMVLVYISLQAGANPARMATFFEMIWEGAVP